jgi:hypothetical protein
MKRFVLIFFVVMTLLFVGCIFSNLNDGKINKDEDSISIDVNYNKAGNAEESNPIDENDYKIFQKEYTAYNKENKPFKVRYAQISGLANENLENKINQTLKSSITEWINKDSHWMEESQLTVKYKTSKYLSLCYTIESKDDKNNLSTYTRIGVTVDMQTGDRVYLSDLIKDTTNLKQKLVSYSYGNEISPPIDSEEAEKIIHRASISEKEYLEEIYKTDPLVYDFMFTYIRVKPSFHLTDKQIVITRDDNKYNDIYVDFKQ